MKILITAEHLDAVLSALYGPAHHIRELQATRGPLVGDDNPINLLVSEYNDAIKADSYSTVRVFREATPDQMMILKKIRDGELGNVNGYAALIKAGMVL